MPEFLLEVGCEELPASFVERAYTDLAAALSKELDALGIKNSEPVAMGTPRRLIVSFPDLKARQEDGTKEQRGPSLSAAYGPDGSPTGALLGFCKGQGITVDELRKDDQYVWLTKHIPGQDTADVLSAILPGIILGLNFDKSMRWGSSKTRFARPIRWVLAAFNENLVPFSVEDVPSSLLSHGHRFYAPTAFEAKNLEELTTKLRNAFVEPVMEMRKERILKQTIAVANGAPEISDDLLDENTFLCEWPTAISGTFPASYLELPEPVLVTAMAKHERMFPVRDANEKLTNSFVFIRNSGEDETVARGCEWVLGARFNDARFFYEQDQKHTLDDFLEKTNDMLFQAQLGTVRQRADRLSKLCAQIAKSILCTEEEQSWSAKAGLYAKADLATGLVSELSSLQGIIGGEYALREGMPSAVATALSQQYTTPSKPQSSPDDKVAMILIIADQMDKLAGYLGLGLEPSGSSDPFGLRKAVTTIIRTAEQWEVRAPNYSEVFDFAVKQYSDQGYDLDTVKAKKALGSIFRSRYEALYDNFRYDVLNAALPDDAKGLMSPRFILWRLQMIEKLSTNDLFVQTATRPINIIAAASKKGESFGNREDVDVDKAQTADAEVLYKLLNTYEPDYEKNMLSLISPINAFFDNNMIMDEDASIRYHRLSLANAAAEAILSVGDFTKLEG
ncbi:MAG: glycine--tRNA ligase subunit beta [Armatimonadota bacterium]